MKKKIGIWIRVSTQDQKQGDSPEVHEKRARMYAESKGWEVVTVYHLEGISGKSVMNQQEAKRMINDVKNGNIDGLIFSKLARLARNTRELLDFADLFEKHNSTLVSLQESIDTSSPAGRLFYTILGAMAQWEREETVERIHASNATRRKMGKMAGGKASFGFKIVQGRLEIDEKEAPIRKLMYELFLEYKRRKTVAEELNRRGYKTRTGAKWSGSTVRGLLENPDAKGMHVANYWDYEAGGGRLNTKPKEEWIITKVPNIVSEELWDAVHAIMNEQEDKNVQHGKPQNQLVHLFTSYLYCNKGHRMKTQSKIKSYTCHACKLKINSKDLESIFHSRLTQFTLSEEEIEAYVKSGDLVEGDKQSEIESIQKQLETIQGKMDKLIELNISGEIPTKGFHKHYDPLHEQSEKLNRHMAGLEKDLDQIKKSKGSMKSIIESSRGVYEKWYDLSRPEKRAIIETITNRINFDGKELEFIFKQINPQVNIKEVQMGEAMAQVDCVE